MVARNVRPGSGLGVVLALWLPALEWIERVPDGRALRVTNAGRRALWRRFEVRLF